MRDTWQAAMARSRRFAVVVGLTLFWSAGGASAETGQRLAALLEGERPVMLENITVTGLVDLSGVRTVSVPFVCRGCRFEGGLKARHVHFERTVDLGGSTISRQADFEGARFNEALLLGEGATIEPAAQFAFASFEDIVDFAGAGLGARADFSSARFQALARFSSAIFAGDAAFAAAKFGQESLFAGAMFLAATSFDGGVFGRLADFRGAQFTGQATFLNADIGGRADFSRAVFMDQARFDDARFAGDGLFVGTEFTAKATPSASFENASVDGRLDFTAAFVHGLTQMLKLAAGALVFTDTAFGERTVLHMNKVSTTELTLALEDVEEIAQAGDQLEALRRIESTAKEAGNLDLANDARYRLQEVASRDDWPPRRLADIVLYRWVAGYLVRPLRPLIWLLGLILLASLVRTVIVEHRARRWQDWRIARTSGRFVKQLAYTVTPKGGGDETPAHRRIELGIYALLLACFLLGLANTNPTLREMVDALI